MTGIATLPTTRDEDWRYSDGEYLAAASPDVVNHWRTLEVPAGETRSEHTFHASGHASGEEVDGMVDRLRVHVGKGGRFEAFKTIAGGKYARVEIEVTLEEGAHFEFGGVTLGGEDKVQEFVTRTIHAHPNATSNQVVRAVQWGQSTGNFLGRIEVARDAQKTDAAQNFRAILLEKGASANTKPELEIFADDVLCAHGAAIGQLDEQASYYMAARGIPPEIARKLLIQAFIGDAFEAIADDAERERMLEDTLANLNVEAV
ncbi:SufD family Fe-S cluster assembly protein [Pontixanthobacter aestiaquae]|uniref:SufD family Fe-S cluster assembly protein n=1 Tax=Pontixanthobacter aestiaquae TaxID=1509367 RepID=A0A844Z499_9SPHN|nr:SufD family Fe-S cluster assembly protein [Pontixanthobacter aestiaquae]MDN3646846.1 SufD family Fe-S cluster assembly protein [Pontixanthobacter aestiaquae]MXO82172.1 SufD family Fe-S cluster assembly protein [Pontixanthobacter aestiaquae]